MRRPYRARRIAMFITLIGSAIIVYAWADGGMHETVQLMVAMTGLVTALTSFVYALLAHTFVRQVERLKRGEGVIAQWNVDPLRWGEFLELNQRLNAAPQAGKCINTRRQDVRPGGVDVVFGRDALLLGDSYYELPLSGDVAVESLHWIDGPPRCLEFRINGWDREDRKMINWILRVPLPNDAPTGPTAVYDHYASGIVSTGG